MTPREEVFDLMHRVGDLALYSERLEEVERLVRAAELAVAERCVEACGTSDHPVPAAVRERISGIIKELRSRP